MNWLKISEKDKIEYTCCHLTVRIQHIVSKSASQYNQRSGFGIARQREKSSLNQEKNSRKLNMHLGRKLFDLSNTNCAFKIHQIMKPQMKKLLGLCNFRYCQTSSKHLKRKLNTLCFLEFIRFSSRKCLLYKNVITGKKLLNRKQSNRVFLTLSALSNVIATT